MADNVSEGCTRLAAALNELAAAHGFEHFRAVAVPHVWGEAAVFDAIDWPRQYAFLAEVLGYANQSRIDVRVLVEHSDLLFAVVPLTGESADDLAAELESVAQWRRDHPDG